MLFESEATILDSHLLSNSFTMPQTSNFESTIKFHGRPILPPVMTDERYEEMAMYKRQAIFTETRLKARARQKLLLRVQAVVDGMNRPTTINPTPAAIYGASTLSSDAKVTSEYQLDQERPTSEQTFLSTIPDTLDHGQTSPRATPPTVVVEFVTTAKTSPRSEAKDSGFSSQGQGKDSLSGIKVVTTDPPGEEPQDTMAEITDISDEDNETPESTTSSVMPVSSRQLTVAERLGTAFKTNTGKDRLESKGRAAAEISARSSTSATTSTTSTDDTTLQDTVMAQPVTPNPSTEILESITTTDLNNEDSNKADESVETITTEAEFDPLSSTRSLLSRVAFNLEEDDLVEEDARLRGQNGNLSEIGCSSQFKDNNAELAFTGRAGDYLVEGTSDTDADPLPGSVSVGQSSSLTICPTMPSDVSQIESMHESTETENAESPDVTESGINVAELDEPTAEYPTAVVSVQNIENSIPCSDVSPSAQNQNSSASDSPQNMVSDSSKSIEASTMYTVSTDIDKYMAGSIDSDTIHSSMTTLPHILDDSVTISELDEPTPLIDTAIINPESYLSEHIFAELSQHAVTVSGDNIEGGTDETSGVVRLSAIGLPTVDVISCSSTDGHILQASSESGLPKPMVSLSSPGKSEAVTQGMILMRRGSYTLDSPSPALLLATHQLTDTEDMHTASNKTVHHQESHKSSYTLDSPSPALLLATQQISDTQTVYIANNGNACHQEVRNKTSYVLDSPSPALLHLTQQITDTEEVYIANNHVHLQEMPKSSHEISQPPPRNSRRDKMNHRHTQSEPPVPTRYELTSSMEDLKLKPVRKTLVFDEECESSHAEHTQAEKNECSEDNSVSDVPTQVPDQPMMIGKQEHLQRYLQTLSQMPQLPPTQISSVIGDSTANTHSNPGEGKLATGSQASSPGQVNLHHMMVQTGATESTNTEPSEDSLSQSLQMEFEYLQGQLLEQQKQQLSQLLVEQQRQQMVMQQEFIKYESMLLQSSATEQDVLLHEQLQERQRELLQTQMAMQQQLRWQMQQQQLELQEQLLKLKQSHELVVAVRLQSVPVGGIGKVTRSRGGKGMRKTWQDKRLPEGWFSDMPLENASGEGPPDGFGHVNVVENGLVQRHIPKLDHCDHTYNAADQSSTDTTLSSDGTLYSARNNVNRSGVSVGSDPFGAQHSDSTMSDVYAHKKHVSFSTDIDTTSDTSQNTSRLGMSEPIPAGYYHVGGQYYPVPSIEPLLETAESATDTAGILSCTTAGGVTSSPGRLNGAVFTQSPMSASHSSRISKNSRCSPKSPRHIAKSGPKLDMHDQVIPPELHKKFERVSAAAKGYLTRRLMASDKVGQLIKTITDTAEFALDFQRESPIKAGSFTNQDKELVDRVLAQLASCMYEIHEIFFEIPIAERMSLIAQTRMLERERLFNQRKAKKREKRLSSATVKALERKKKAQAAERAVFGNLRPKSCPPTMSSPRGDKRPDLSGPLRRNYQYMMSRVLKPIQAHLSPIKPVKDTLNSNPLRSSYDKLYMRALKRAVAMEKKEQREKATLKQKSPLLNTKNVKSKVISHIGSKKSAAANHGVKSPVSIHPSAANHNTAPKRPPFNPNPPPRPKSTTQTHPWK